tara:strand:+ start:802 stop:939 length:138 start_codon:yes stop_codon:yes gene_type:complete
MEQQRGRAVRSSGLAARGQPVTLATIWRLLLVVDGAETSTRLGDR